VREKDLPEAPPEPPPTGYVVFVGQMTTKIRHDRPNVPHDQAKGKKKNQRRSYLFLCRPTTVFRVTHSTPLLYNVPQIIITTLVVQEISKLWRIGMSEQDRNYYNDFAMDAKNEYERQVIEYRATGKFTPSQKFDKLVGVNVWVRRFLPNGLETEIASYTTCLFPPRPPQLDAAYELREERSKLRRKLKLKGLVDNDGKLKQGLDFEALLEQERATKRHISSTNSTKGDLNENIAASNAAEEIGEETEEHPGAATAAEGPFFDI
jgi:hypothetical protein